MASRAQVRRRALLALAAVLVGGGALLALLGRGSPLPASDDLAPSRTAVHAPRDKPPSDAVVLTGRCVDARTLSPIAWGTVRMYGIDLTDSARWTAAWRMDPVRSDDDGRFRVEVTPPPGLSFTLTIDGDGYVATSWSPALATGTEQDLGDIPLRRGGKISCRVVDTTGTPRAGISFRLVHHESKYRDDLVSWLRQSQSDGTFPPEYLLPGTWNLALAGDEECVALQSPLTVEIPDDGSDTEVTVVLFADGDLAVNEGIVVDEDGNPIPDVMVLRGIVTDAQGRFRHQIPPTSHAARFGRQTYALVARGYEADEYLQKHPVGTRTITFRMHRVPPVNIGVTVMDEVREQPLEAFDVICLQRAAAREDWENPGWHLCATSFGPHPGGRTRLDNVSPGERVVLVRRLGADAAFVHATRLTLGAANAHVIAGLAIPVELRLDVVGPSGEPIADSLVELLLPLDDRPLSMTSSAVESLRDWHTNHLGYDAVLLHSARTDREGRVVLRGPTGHALGVRILGPGHVPEVRQGVRLDGPPLQIRVRRGATLLGRLPASLCAGSRDVAEHPRRDPRILRHGLISARPRWPEAVGYALDFDPDASGLQLQSMPPESSPLPTRALPSSSHLFPIDPDGRFQATGLEPGNWKVRLRVPSLEAGWGTWFALGSVSLRDGEVRRLEIDSARLEPGLLTGTLRGDGQPLRDRILGFTPVELWLRDDLESQWIACETDAQGRFAVRLLAGRWRPAVIARSRAEGDTQWIFLPGEVEIHPGTTTTADLAFTRRRLTVRAVDATNQPRAFVRLRVTFRDNSLNVFTDHEGRFVVDPLIGEASALRIHEHDHGLGWLDVPAEPRDPELTVVLR